MDKLAKALDDEELTTDLEEVLTKSGVKMNDSKLEELISDAKNQMVKENISGGSIQGVIRGVGILSGVVMGGVVSGNVIPKATGIGASKEDPTATIAVAAESAAGMGSGAYIGYELSDAIVKFLEKKNILEPDKK